MSSFACTGPGLIKIPTTPASNIGQVQRPAHTFPRLSATDPNETVQAVGDTPETDRTNALRGSEANSLDRFLFLNLVSEWAIQSDHVREWAPPSPNLPKLPLGWIRPVAAHFRTNRAHWARGVVGRVSFSTRAVGQLPSR